jgi:lycopene cyclase domain-containing protein
MSTYFVINFLIIIFPILFSFDKKVSYYKNILPVLISTLTVGLIYILWDVFAVIRGDWYFNPEFVYGILILNLPVEEILFFITVPYSCIFIYEVIKSYTEERLLSINRRNLLIPIFILIIIVLIFRTQYYTFTVLLFSAAFLFLAFIFFYSIIESRVYWLTVIISYLPFFIVNYFLTSLPVVQYRAEAIWGIRVLTIPLEDFFYSYSLISFWLLVYLISKKIISRKSLAV